jgi:hypothetical protein
MARSARTNHKAAIISQAKQFIETARALGCDEDEAHFDTALKKVAQHKPSHTTNDRQKHEVKNVRGEDRSENKG